MSFEWQGQTVLAPLTKGGNLPFRRLCADFGAEITFSEMVYARKIRKGDRRELALIRKSPHETHFGVQIAANKAEDAVEAGKKAANQGAAFIDINAGCPIHDAVRRGLGASLLKRPSVLARMVEALRAEIPLPITVKLRAGWDTNHINASKTAAAVIDAGACAVTLHGRTREQRYTKSADWELVSALVSESSVPIIGNGDILTYYEARARKHQSGCAALMIGRGALIKPWLFQEIRDQRAWEPTPVERVELYLRLAHYMKEHFRDDERGHKRAMGFLPWHLGFLSRYRPLPEEQWGEYALKHPLIQTRFEDNEELPLLERLLRDPRVEIHECIAEELWLSRDLEQALEKLSQLADTHSPQSGFAETSAHVEG